MTQESQIIEQLNAQGLVSRNWALRNYITRLGAIICNLNKKGWVIEGKYYEYSHGKDFVYTVIKKPYNMEKIINKPVQPQMFKPGNIIK
mgnify:CR=1 FL=1